MTELLADLDTVERSIATVRSVHKVVSAIWAMARAQVPHVDATVRNANDYLTWVDETVDRLVGQPTPGEDAALAVVFGPERAYCGSLPRYIAEQLPTTGPLGIVGSRLAVAAASDTAMAARISFRIPGAVTHQDHERVASQTAREILAHAEGRQVELMYPVEGQRALQRAVLVAGVRHPLENPVDTYSPRSELLRHALQESITGRLAVAAAEVLRAEVHARLRAADAARTACDGRLETLEHDWRTARQDRITSELLEVVAGRLDAIH